MLTNRKISSWIKTIFVLILLFCAVWFFTKLNGAELIVSRVLPDYHHRTTEKRNLKKEKTELLLEMENLKLRNIELEQSNRLLTDQRDALLENVEIKKHWEENSSLTGISAMVVMRDPYKLYNTLLIDKGKNDGILKGMPVAGQQEIIGRVSEVFDEFSRVRTIHSPRLAFGAVVERTRELGVLTGGRQFMSLTYLTINSDVSPGDIIITSGTTDITPGGLLLGKVVEVIKKEPEEELNVKVESSEEIDKLQAVWVITAFRDIPENITLKEGSR